MHFASDKELVLEDLKPLINFIHETLEAAIQNVIMDFQQKGREVCKAVLPDMVRYEALLLLKQSQEDMHYRVEDLARNGLCVHYRAYHIKILMADKGAVPNAGRSLVNQCFYSQMHLPSPFSDIPSKYEQRGIQESSLSLLFTWQANTTTGILSLKLVCPKYATSNRTVLYWEENINHPALSLSEKEVVPNYTDTMDDDLGISLPDQGELGNQMG